MGTENTGYNFVWTSPKYFLCSELSIMARVLATFSIRSLFDLTVSVGYTFIR